MELRFIIVVVVLSVISKTQSQDKIGPKTETCKIKKKHLGKEVEMKDKSQVQGTRVDFSDYCYLREVYEFRGLRYEEFSLRFFRTRGLGRALETNKQFATNFRPACPQKRMREAGREIRRFVFERWGNKSSSLTEHQSEDCQWLNLYLPKTNWNETKLPVMVFVHGESYEVGTGNAYDGSVLASYGRVIVITVNYRLGALGFLSTGDKKAEGNYAVWDLMAILYWVNENIAGFGGDKSRVTLFGHGHGAALVNVLLVSNALIDKRKIEDLVNNVILQSGSAFSTWAQSIDPVRCTHILARKVNCSYAINNTNSLVECLRGRSVDELVRNVPVAPKYYTCFAPSLGLGTFPTGKSLEDLIASGNTAFHNKKIIFGLTRKEAYSYLKQDEIVNGISESRKQQIIRTYVQNVYKYHRQKIFDILKHEYTQYDRPDDNFSRRDDIMDLLSDGQYKAPLIRMAREHAKVADTYMYSFAYSTQSEDFAQWTGGVHGDELPYIFGAPLVGGLSPFPTSYNTQEMELSKFMMRMWTNFAKTGDPNLPEWGTAEKDHSNSAQFSGVRWPKYNTSTQSYLHIGRRGPRLKDYFRGKQADLWLNLIPKLNDKDGTNASDAVHELDNADNMSTFDDPSRLISKSRLFFPGPPPPPSHPPYITPIMSDSSIGTKEKPEETTQDPITVRPNPVGVKENSSRQPTNGGVPVSSKTDHGSKSDSGIPVSVVLVIGCILLFSNLLLVAGICFQRRKVSKLQEGQSAAQINSLAHVDRHDHLNNTMNRQIGASPETVNLMSSKDTLPHAKTASLNHKPPLSDNAPMYSSISKPVVSPQGPGGYTYSALSQKSSSPMHSKSPVVPQSQATSFTNVVQYSQGGPPSESGGSQASSRTNDSLPRPQPPMSGDRSPKVDSTRTKQINRGNHQVTSNNAITIV